MDQASAASSEESSFEADLAQLTDVVEALEKGDLSLEKSLRLYEEGAKLTERCTKQLQDAELRVTQWQGGAADSA